MIVASLVSLVIASAVGFVAEWRVVTSFVELGDARSAFSQLTGARVGSACPRSRWASQFLGVGYALAISTSVAVRMLAPGLRLPGAYAVWVGAGFAVATLATILRAWSVCTLGEFFDRDGLLHARHLLVRSGPYRVVRHPAYTANVVFALAVGLMLVNWGSLAVASFAAVAVHVPRIRFEEASLRRRFPDDYREYAQRTGLITPRRPRRTRTADRVLSVRKGDKDRRQPPEADTPGSMFREETAAGIRCRCDTRLEGAEPGDTASLLAVTSG